MRFTEKCTLQIVNQRRLVELCPAVIQQRRHRADDPTGGIAQGDGEYLVADEVRHDVEVALAEHDERGEHEDHGHLTVARAAQRTRIDLVDAAEDVERREQRSRSVP